MTGFSEAYQYVRLPLILSAFCRLFSLPIINWTDAVCEFVWQRSLYLQNLIICYYDKIRQGLPLMAKFVVLLIVAQPAEMDFLLEVSFLMNFRRQHLLQWQVLMGRVPTMQPSKSLSFVWRYSDFAVTFVTVRYDCRISYTKNKLASWFRTVTVCGVSVRACVWFHFSIQYLLC